MAGGGARRAEVALAVGAVLQELAHVVAVPLGRPKLGRRLHHQQPRLDVTVEAPPVDQRARDVDVVALDELDVAEHGVERPLAVVDVDQLVVRRVLVERVLRHRVRRDAHRHDDVGVAHDGHAAGQPVAAGLDLGPEKVAVGQERLLGVLDRHVLGLADGLDERGRVDVVGDGADPVEALLAQHLLGVEGAVGALELGVALGRDLAALDVEAHDRVRAKKVRVRRTAVPEAGRGPPDLPPA